MTVNIKCPKCDDELEFEHTSDLQGEGCWAMHVDFVDLVGQNCKCTFTDEEFQELQDRAYTASEESQPYFSMIY